MLTVVDHVAVRITHGVFSVTTVFLAIYIELPCFKLLYEFEYFGRMALWVIRHRGRPDDSSRSITNVDRTTPRAAQAIDILT